MFAILTGDGCNTEVLDAATANPSHFLMVVDVIDDPQPLDLLLGALTLRCGWRIEAEVNPQPFSLCDIEIGAIDALSEDLNLQLLAGLCHLAIYLL